MGLQPGTTVGALIGVIGVITGAILTFISKRGDRQADEREQQIEGFRADLTEARNETARLALRIEQLQARQDSDRATWDARATAYNKTIDRLRYQNIMLRRLLEREHIALPEGLFSRQDEAETP